MAGNIEKRGKNSYRLVCLARYDLQGRPIKKTKTVHGSKTLKPLSDKTILEHHRLLRAMLHKAVYWQMIVSNPVKRVQPPKAKKSKRRYYDDEQCKILLGNLTELSEDQIKYKVAIILTVFTEVRLGELMGLEWNDVNFRDGIVSINRSSQYLADKGVFTKTSKTESSIREVTIPDFVISLLGQYKLWYEEQKSLYGELWTDSNRLFVQADGKPMPPSTISKCFVRYVAQICSSYYFSQQKSWKCFRKLATTTKLAKIFFQISLKSLDFSR